MGYGFGTARGAAGVALSAAAMVVAAALGGPQAAHAAAGALAAQPPSMAASAASAAAQRELEGTLEIVVEDHANASRTRHYLRTAQGRTELRFDGAPPRLHSGARLRVRGSTAGTALLVTSADASSLTVTAAAPASVTQGEQKTAVLLVNFSDDASQPFTLAQGRDAVLGQASSFLRENSFQTTWLAGDAYGWLTLPIASTCLTSDIATAAKQAAASAGVNLAAYTRFVYLFPPNMSCGWAGVGSVGGSPTDAWINGTLDTKVVVHELGHNLGLQHSHASDCDATPLGPNCTFYDYGDVADAMGNTTPGHYNAFQKERLGWLNAGTQPPITTVTASGSYAIGAYEDATLNAKALKVLKSVDPVTGARTWYYVEYRRPLGFDAGLATLYASNLVNGVLVHTATDGDRNSSTLLDMTPNTVATFDFGDAALVPGQSFSDGASGVTLVVVSADAGQANVSVTVGSAASCVRGNPGIAASGGATAVAAGTTVSYSTTVTNTDSAGCGASTIALQATPPSGWSGSYANPSLSLMPGASATTTLSVTSAATAAAGSYAVALKASNSASPTSAGTASASYLVGGTLATSVATNSAAYRSNDTVAMTANVSAGGKPVANAGVSFRLVKPDGSTVLKSATTNGSGVASASYRLGRKDPKGAWQLRDDASYNGATANATSSFSVN